MRSTTPCATHKPILNCVHHENHNKIMIVSGDDTTVCQDGQEQGELGMILVLRSFLVISKTILLSLSPRFAFLTLSALLVACSSSHSLVRLPLHAQANEGDADQEMQVAVAACHARLNQLESWGKGYSIAKITLGAVGLVAGAVIVPALAARAVVAKSSVAAWGGIAGAASGGVALMDSQKLGEAAQAAESLRTQLVADWSEYAAAKGSNPPDYAKALGVAYKMQGECEWAKSTVTAPK
jgi:hypothetical protein